MAAGRHRAHGPRRTRQAPRRVLETELPAGVHYLTPLSAGGTGVAVGKSQAVAIIDPVTSLVTTPFADHATVAWHWPATVQLAEVSWRAQGDSEDDWQSEVLSRAQYRVQGRRARPARAAARARSRSAP